MKKPQTCIYTLTSVLSSSLSNDSKFKNGQQYSIFEHLIILILAVLAGDLKSFNQVVDKFRDKFLAEKTYTLIIRWAV